MPSHQRIVFADPVAFRYLERGNDVTVLADQQELREYECYLVEQWACSRSHPTFIIATYTGDASNSIKVGVLGVPSDEAAWSPRLKLYMRSLTKYHTRARETPLGSLMVTNLSGFPSSLTVIPVPDGDPHKHREDFFVNENLKRLGCSGRVGLTLTKPSPSTIAKFYQLYKASDKVPLYQAVIELVKLCQVALMFFGKLDADYADGLLCDFTERAINDWWNEFGTEYYNIEPHDGILGPTTVAALLGMLLGAQNRLGEFGAPIGKDVFDVEKTMRAIAYFQKYQNLTKSRRLDRHTLERLHRVTAKDASGSGGWKVGRAVKSTVAELSGKGGEMIMDAFGGRDKAGIADVETVDIDQLVQLVHGERLKWLWQGKLRKAATNSKMFDRLPGQEPLVFQKNEKGELQWSAKKGQDAQDLPPLEREDSRLEAFEPDEIDAMERGRLQKKHHHKRTISKTGAGIGRIKDRVGGLRGHGYKHSRDGLESGSTLFSNGSGDLTTPRHELSRQPTLAMGNMAGETIPEHAADDSAAGGPDSQSDPAFTRVLTETPVESQSHLIPDGSTTGLRPLPSDTGGYPPRELVSQPPTVGSSVAGSTYHGVDLDDLFEQERGVDQKIGHYLRRTRSFSRYEELSSSRDEARYSRHLSFSIAESSILTFELPSSVPNENGPTDPKAQLALELASAEDARRAREELAWVEGTLIEWVKRKVEAIHDLERLTQSDQQSLNELVYQRQDLCHVLEHESRELLEQERTTVLESIKDVEVFGAKLEYEINALRGKVEDVEDAVVEYERQVSYVESLVGDLEEQFKVKEGWGHWMVRVITGLGTAPEAVASN